MHFNEIYGNGRFGISIEVFPPKPPAVDKSLFLAIERLMKYRPDCISCTCGAGGSTRGRTIELCGEIQKRFSVSATSHFTCIGSSKDQLLETLSFAKKSGIQNILALRGDPPQGDSSFRFTEGGFKHANELVALIREHFPELGIAVAAYPEKHVEAPDPKTDLENLKRKVDAGADVAYTQLFFENKYFFNFYERYQAAGIKAHLIPGIMPIIDFSRIQQITSMCGTRIPEKLAARFEAVKDDPKASLKVGVEHAVHQCQELIAQGVPGIHLYALNLSRACRQVLEAIGR
ncbi:MAG: methylenetetrahydrofolate reductase [NAD(P)H] [Deltaproteobacteria bacterium]|nr:methylenetetrahydrofolate reductase [NAD(P)H] [Deltaproteobacteria bacterium]